MNCREGENSKEWNDLSQTLGNDGFPLEQERNTYPFNFSPAPGNSVLPISPKLSFLHVIRGAVTDDFHFQETPEYHTLGNKVVIDGFDLATLSSTEIDKMTPEFACSFLNKIHLEGNLMKKGFRNLRLWKRRFFILNGNELLYYSVLSA